MKEFKYYDIANDRFFNDYVWREYNMIIEYESAKREGYESLLTFWEKNFNFRFRFYYLKTFEDTGNASWDSKIKEEMVEGVDFITNVPNGQIEGILYNEWFARQLIEKEPEIFDNNKREEWYFMTLKDSKNRNKFFQDELAETNKFILNENSVGAKDYDTKGIEPNLREFKTPEEVERVLKFKSYVAYRNFLNEFKKDENANGFKNGLIENSEPLKTQLLQEINNENAHVLKDGLVENSEPLKRQLSWENKSELCELIYALERSKKILNNGTPISKTELVGVFEELFNIKDLRFYSLLAEYMSSNKITMDKNYFTKTLHDFAKDWQPKQTKMK